MNERGQSSAPASWLVCHGSRIAEVGFGHALYAAFNWFFDNVLYVFVVYQLGWLRGGALMTLLSMFQCGASLMLYERMRIDWVGAGSIARLSGLPAPTWWQRTLIWADRQGTVFIFVALCVLQDPFITTAYFRGGQFDGLRRRDWQLFLASVLVSNGYWTLRSGTLAALLVGASQWLMPGVFR